MAARTTKTADPLEDKKIDMTETSEKVTVTLKGGASFDAPWVVVHADSAADALGILKDGSTKELLDFVAQTGQYFAGLAPKAPAPAGGASSNGRPANADEPESRFCKHGKMTFRSGTNARGTWRAFMCPTPKGTPDQCSAEFLKS